MKPINELTLSEIDELTEILNSAKADATVEELIVPVIIRERTNEKGYITCPYCDAPVKKNGLNRNNIQEYRCKNSDCKKYSRLLYLSSDTITETTIKLVFFVVFLSHSFLLLVVLGVNK